MPTPIFLNVPSATDTNIADMRAGCDVAAANGFAGVRFSAGLSSYGNNDTVSTTTLVSAVTYAVGKGLKCQILLNLEPKYNGTKIKALNGSLPLPVPTLPTNPAVLDYVARGWQDFVNACRSVTSDSNLIWEWLNEPGIGGNQDPLDKDPDTGAETHRTYSGPSGTIVPDFWTSLDYVSAQVDFHACPTICVNLEGEGSSVAQVEVNSVTGTAAQNCINRATYIGTNRYADAPTTPYNAAITKAAYSAKLAAQLARMAANPLIGPKAVRVGEFGLDSRRCPSCSIANAIRDDLASQMVAETAVASAGFFCYTDYQRGKNKAGNSPFWFYAWHPDGVHAPLDGVPVTP